MNDPCRVLYESATMRQYSKDGMLIAEFLRKEEDVVNQRVIENADLLRK